MLEALKEVVSEMQEVEELISSHRLEATAALQHHRSCIDGSTERYMGFSKKYETLLKNLRDADSSVEGKSELIKTFADHASKGWFESCSDYQQDKPIPSWNLSPQPGPTYYMSSLTHYVHILCVESCGMPSGQSKYSRNLIYTRSERVGGSKVADDTLTTLSHALLGYKTATFQQPHLYRTGYEDNGLINVMVDEEQPNIDDHVQGDQKCENSNTYDDEIRHNFISVKESGGSDGATNEVEEGLMDR